MQARWMLVLALAIVAAEHLVADPTSCINSGGNRGFRCFAESAKLEFAPLFLVPTGVARDYFVAVAVPNDTHQWSAVVHVPPQLPPLAPVVIAFHGFNNSGRFMMCYTGLNRFVDAAQMITVYPNANSTSPWLNGSWPSLYRRDDAPAFLRYFDALLAMLLGSGRIDASRVFVTGVSNGGNAVALLGQARSSVVRAISMVAGADTVTANLTERPSPVSVHSIHGTADVVVPYRSVAPFLNQWAQWDHFNGSVSSAPYAPNVTAFAWSGLAGGTHMQALRCEHGRHAWPCSDIPYGGGVQTFHASKAIVDFFSSFQQEQHGGDELSERGRD